jgi:site-specific recombinase XerD
MRATPGSTFDRGSLAVWRDFERDLQAKQVRAQTIEHYGHAAVQLYLFAGKTPLLAVTRAQIAGYLADLGAVRERVSPASGKTEIKSMSRATIDTRYRALRRFYRWAHAEELLPGGNPIARIEAPQLSEHLIPVITPDDERALLRACAGKDHDSLRDTALIRLLLCPGGPRAAEITGLTLAETDMIGDVVLISNGKWARDRLVPFGPLAGKALSKYLRAREQRPDAAACPQVFLGKRGALSRSGLLQMLKRRCREAGVREIGPHTLRHTAVHRYKGDGGDVALAKKLFGWRTDAMWQLYGESAAAALAVEHGRASAARTETRI